MLDELSSDEVAKAWDAPPLRLKLKGTFALALWPCANVDAFRRVGTGAEEGGGGLEVGGLAEGVEDGRSIDLLAAGGTVAAAAAAAVGGLGFKGAAC